MGVQINVIIQDGKFYTLTKSSAYVGVSRSRYLSTILNINFQGGDETVTPLKVLKPYTRHAIALPVSVKRELEDRCNKLNCTYSEYINGFLI